MPDERELLDDLVEQGLVPVDEPWLPGAPWPGTYQEPSLGLPGWVSYEDQGLAIANTLAFTKVKSESFIKGPLEPKPYEPGILDVLVMNSVKEIQEQEDARFLQMLLDADT